MSAVGQETVEQGHDVLLPGGGLVELPAHLREPGPHLVLEPVEARRGSHAEGVDGLPVRIDLDAEVGDIAVLGAGQAPGCGGVDPRSLSVLPGSSSLGRHLLDAGLDRGEPRFGVG